ncbi:MAG: glycosyltransferase [Bacteroidia bacterium]|nr:glycosyltransferase [Bacteroidia bacterium]
MLNHLLFLSPGFPADEADTPCLPTVQALVKETARVFPETFVSVVSTQYPFTAGEYRWKGHTIYSAGGKNRRFPLRLKTWYDARNYILALHRRRPVSLIHSFWLSECALIGHFTAQKLRIPHLTTVMGQDARKGNPYLRILPLEKMNLVGLSEFHVAQFYETTGINLSNVVPWGIETQDFPPFNAGERPIDLLGVGSLIPLKNYGVMIETAARLREKFPRLRCELVGDGVEREMLEKKAEARGLKEHFRFCGQLPREQVLEKMRRSRVLFHPSGYESFGYVFSEALYSGMKVCSRKTGIAGAHGETADTDEEMLKLAESLLSQPYNPLREKVPTIYESVQTYRELYRSWGR